MVAVQNTLDNMQLGEPWHQDYDEAEDMVVGIFHGPFHPVWRHRIAYSNFFSSELLLASLVPLSVLNGLFFSLLISMLKQYPFKYLFTGFLLAFLIQFPSILNLLFGFSGNMIKSVLKTFLVNNPLSRPCPEM